MNKLLKNCLGLKFELKKPGITKIKIANKKIAGTIWSKVILTIPKTFSFLEEFFYTWIRLFIFYFSKSF